ncbi:hypothetical protein [Pseudomonas syringae]|uniref:hypothetical protein n=1 Tax=Pseudomonas syringae TaxID=317 RepID=UPI000467C6AC|nr:hypothetical protein [Pseudomonas syringae]
MFANIFKYFSKGIPTNKTSMVTYDQLFEKSKKFTSHNKLALDTTVESQSQSQSQSQSHLQKLIDELTTLICDFTEKYNTHGFDPITRFGGDCGNVHFSVINFIKDNYPSIQANITIGDISIENQTHFPFNQKKCLAWLKKGSPKIFDCHAWITINNDYILDCTIGTYINTRIDPEREKNKENNLYGGLIHGQENHFKNIKFSNLDNKTPQNFNKIKYSPIIVGLQAFKKICPRQT